MKEKYCPAGTDSMVKVKDKHGDCNFFWASNLHDFILLLWFTRGEAIFVPALEADPPWMINRDD